jgi:hypothetical protein
MTIFEGQTETGESSAQRSENHFFISSGGGGIEMESIDQASGVMKFEIRYLEILLI